MRIKLPSRRSINLLGLGVCVLMLAAAYYLEYHEGLRPCPLCVIQRLSLIPLGMVFLTAALQNPTSKGARRYGFLIAFVAGIGVAVAGYQIWLQHLPTEAVVFCLPPLDYLLASLPLLEAFTILLESPGHCSDILWTFMGLSIAEWSFLGFAGLGTAGALRNLTEDPR